MAVDVTIRALALDGTWETIGVDRARGIHPTNVTLAADLWGPSKATFDLLRDPGTVWPDLRAYTPIEVECDGMLVWGGRIAETPSRDGADRQINVQADGWQFHLDDNPYEQLYAHTKLDPWRDTRSFLGADLAKFLSTPKVQSGDGVITIGYANGDAVAAGEYVGVTLDLGPNRTAHAIAVEWERLGVSNPDQTLYARGHDLQDPASGSGTPEDAFSFTLDGSASGTSTGTFTTARRYVSVFMYRNGAGDTYGADFLARLKAIRVFGQAAYMSAGASVLRASAVYLDALVQGTQLLSSDLSALSATSFDLTDFTPQGRRTPREMITAVNAAHDWLTQITADRRPVFRPKPSAPTLMIGSWGGSTFADASQNSGEEIYDRVAVTGQDAAGDPVDVVRTQTGTLVDRCGGHRTKEVAVRSTLATTLAQQIGDVWLDAHRTTPARGTSDITRLGVRDFLSGASIPPAVLLTRTGELLHHSNAIDPDTGGVGRDVRLADVTYKPAADAASVTLDNSRANVEALLERLAIVSGAG